MIVLAIETATRAGSLALWAADACVGRAGDALRTHGERLPREAVAFLADHGRRLADVDLFAIVSGPGSFTGLRVGMAAVQGLALPSGRRVVAVPTLDALAESWLLDHPGEGVLAACLDGHRREVFAAAWDVGQVKTVADARVLVEPLVGAAADVGAVLAGAAGDRAPVTIVGDGAERYRDALLAAMPRATVARPARTLAEAAARLAAARPDAAVLPHALRPLYVRRPDAVIARERARAAGERDIAQCTVRRATPADALAAVAALEARAFASATDAGALRRTLEQSDVFRLYLMHAPGDALVGYCAGYVVADEFHINSLAVDEAWRRQGAARRLLAEVFRDARASGATSATLEVRRSNHAARRLYEGLGFVVEGERPRYYSDPVEDALVLWNRRIKS